MSLVRLFPLVLLTGCIPLDSTSPEPIACADSSEIDRGAALTYAVGVDAGYYVSYLGDGHWHVEWTCDTRVSAYGCNFTGTITAPAPAQGPNATCVMCEYNDGLSTGVDTDGNMRIDFDTVTTTGTDGVDFYTTAGSTVTLDLLVDGTSRPDLVFVPSRGASRSPSCTPLALTPDSP
jgi:hypothetical protein